MEKRKFIQGPSSECQTNKKKQKKDDGQQQVDAVGVARFEPLMKIIDKIADGKIVPPNITMRYEMLRFCTLRSYPKENKPFITRIAQAGFYYANNGDELVCYCCARRKSNWDETDNPLEVHRQMNPNCRFLVKNAEVNVPIKNEKVSTGSLVCARSESNALERVYKSEDQTSGTSNQGLVSVNVHNVDAQSAGINMVPATNYLYESSKEEILRDHELPVPYVDTATVKSFEPLMNIINKMADGEAMSPQITMRYEMLRFCTLCTYPKENKPFITRIAQAGFYYANSGDEVICYCCGGTKSGWNGTDVPMDVHRQLNPQCRFLIRNSEVNVPIKDNIRSSSEGADNNLSITRSVQSPSASGPVQSPSAAGSVQSPSAGVSVKTTSAGVSVKTTSAGVSIKTTSAGVSVKTTSAGVSVKTASSAGPAQSTSAAGSAQATPAAGTETEEANDARNTQSKTTKQSSSDDDNVPPQTVTKYPKYSEKEARAQSFNECGDISISTHSLAESGFFYAGLGDCVRCFKCGLGLRNWSKEDDPWIEHSRWSKDCSFVREMRGQKFVNLVQMAVQNSHNDGAVEACRSDEVNIDETSTKQRNDKKGKLMQQPVCKICLMNDACIVFLPCGHSVACADCAPCAKQCISCRSVIQGTVRTYWA